MPQSDTNEYENLAETAPRYTIYEGNAEKLSSAVEQEAR